jgi:hypothetical protein
MSEKSSKIEIFSWPVRLTSRFGFQRFFIAFRLDSILNKQKIIKKTAFLVKMVSFRPNHKSFSGFVASKKYTEILRKDQI